MKSYNTWQRWETEFDGLKVGADLKRLSRRGLITLYPLMEKFDKLKNDDIISMMELIDQGVPVLADHVKSFTGFEIDGHEPTIEDIADDVSFTPLIIQLMSELVRISSMTKIDSKNSVKPSIPLPMESDQPKKLQGGQLIIG